METEIENRQEVVEKVETENVSTNVEAVPSETKQTEVKNFDQVGIGTRETQTLAQKPVLVTGYKKVNVPSKNDPNKSIGEKIVFVVKHPDRTDPVELSKARYLKNDKVTTSGLWYNLDDDGLLPKKSALAVTLAKYECKSIHEIVGKTLDTDLDGDYLVVKAY